jgi:hypothetical protein
LPFFTELAVGGSITTLVGVIMAANEPTYSHYVQPGEVVILIGLTAMVASVPLFIASGKNKRKAHSATLKIEKLMLPATAKITYRYFPALVLKINIR